MPNTVPAAAAGLPFRPFVTLPRSDLSRLSVAELVTVYEGAMSAFYAFSHHANQPRCGQAGGDVIDNMVDPLGHIATDAIEELRARAPNDPWQVGLRLRTLAEQALHEDDWPTVARLVLKAMEGRR